MCAVEEDGHAVGVGPLVPRDVGGLDPVLRVACGGEHTLVLLGGGRVAACGDNNFNQCLADTDDDEVATSATQKAPKTAVDDMFDDVEAASEEGEEADST